MLSNDLTYEEHGKAAFVRCGWLLGAVRCRAEALERIIAERDLDSETTKLLSEEIRKLRTAPALAEEAALQQISEDRIRKVQRSVHASEPANSNGPLPL